MKWETAKFGLGTKPVSDNLRPKSLEWTLSKLSFLENHTRRSPILLFIYANEDRKTSRKSKPTPTTQKLRSRKLEASVFKDDSLKMQICSRFFTCYRMDLAGITKEKSPALYSAKAPMVVIFDQDGTLLSIHKSGLSSVFGGLCKAVKPYCVDLPGVYRDAYSQVRDLHKNEMKLYGLKEDLKEAQAKAKPSGKRKVSSVYIKKAEKAKKLVTECEELSEEIKKKYKEILIKHSRDAAKKAAEKAAKL